MFSKKLNTCFELKKWNIYRQSEPLGARFAEAVISQNWMHWEGRGLFAAIHAPLSHPSISLILSGLLYSQKQNLHKGSLEARVRTASLSPWDNSKIEGIFREPNASSQVFRSSDGGAIPNFKYDCSYLIHFAAACIIYFSWLYHAGSA